MISIARRRTPPLLALARAALLSAAMCLAGCAGSTVADHLPPATGGLPQNAPQRPSTPGEYPAVHDMPPARTSTVLTEEEQRKLEQELIAARKRVGSGAKSGGSARSK